MQVLGHEQLASIVIYLCELNYEIFKLSARDETGSVMVILNPRRHEVLNFVHIHRKIELVILTCERIENDRYEDVEEDLRDDDLEANVIAEGDCWNSTSE